MGALEWLLLRRFAWRHWRLAPGASSLLVVILALGVGVFTSIRLANRAAVASFGHFTDTLTGQSDFTLQAPAGSLPESVLGEIRAGLGPRGVDLFPVVEASAARPETGDTSRYSRPVFTLLGLDLVSLANLARPTAAPGLGTSSAGPEAGGPGEAFWAAVRGGPGVWLSPSFPPPTPRELALIVDEHVVHLPVAGILPAVPEAPAPPPTLLVMDLRALQGLVGRPGQLDRIECVVEPGAAAARVRQELPALLNALGKNGARWIVTTPAQQRATAETITRAFRLNLTVLSLLALLVGLYLIFQALDGAVVRRRPEIAVLRSLGVTEGAIRRAWLIESAALGLVGGAAGLLLGWAGAQLSVRAVGQTVNALYYATTVASARLSWDEAGLGLALGVVTALVAGWWPARAAARTLPAHVWQRTGVPAPGRTRRRLALVGTACLAAAAAVVRLPPLRFEGGSRFPLAGYASAFLWIFGCGVLCAFLLPPLARALRLLAGRAAFAVALSHLRVPSGRHRLALAALLCAIAMTAGMAILVASFEQTMRGWIGRTLQADLYVASAGAQSASAENRLGATAAEALSRHPAIAAANALLVYPIVLDGAPTLLTGTDLDFLRRHTAPTWVRTPRDDTVFDPARNAGLALVSESFTERFRVGPGATLTLPTPAGPRTVQVAGVFADYGNERGSILVDLVHLREWFGETGVTNLSLYVRPGVNAETVRQEFLRRFPGLSIFTNSQLRSEVLRIFRQTFSITYALEVIGVAVAVIGLALTLASILLDRREELTTLRALGFSRHEIALTTSCEGLALSTCAVIGGLGASLALGWLLIFVINKQSFGWTLSFALPLPQLAALAAAVAAVGTAVSYGVGRWGARLPADQEE